MGIWHRRCEIPGVVNPHHLFDHAEYFRHRAKPYRAAAIVAHNYGNVAEEAKSFAAKHGLIAHVVPGKMASWYYPGATQLVCYVRPSTIVAWPEDMVRVWWEKTYPTIPSRPTGPNGPGSA